MAEKGKSLQWVLVLSGVISLFIGYKLLGPKNVEDKGFSNTLVENIGIDVDNLNPQQTADAAAIRVNNDIFEGLLEYNQDGEVICAAAENYEVSNDGLIYTFNLRKNLKWSNGDPLTAYDFLYSFQRAVSKETLSKYFIDLYKNIKNADEIIKGEMPAIELGVSAEDDYTFKINLVVPDSTFLIKLAIYAFRPICKKAFEKYGDRAYTSPETTISNGSYIIENWTHNKEVILKKNVNYWNAANVSIENIKFLMIIDGVAAMQAFDSGTIDISSGKLPVKEESWYLEKYNSKFHKYEILNLERYIFNFNNKKFSDIRVRKALNIVIDRKSLIKKVAITAKEVYSPILETSFSDKYNNIDNAMPEYDWVNKPMNERIEMGKKLLAEAGYSKDKPLKFTLSYNSNDINKNVAVAIQTIWNTIFEGSVVVDVYSNDQKTHIANIMNLNYDIGRTQWCADYASTSNFIDLYSPCPMNFQGYNNDKVNALYEESKKQLTFENTEAIYYEISKVLMEDYPIIPLFSVNVTRLVQDRVKGYNHKGKLEYAWSKYYSLDSCKK